MFVILLEKLKHKKALLESEIQSLESTLSKFPPGKLLVTRNNKYFKWFHYHNCKKIPISKKDSYFAEKLAEKTYLTYQLEDLKLELHALTEKINILAPSYGKAYQFLHTPSETLRLFLKRHTSLEKDLLKWQNSPYKKNPNHPEDLINNTITGEKVRSKSEVIIYTALLEHNIPFHYEEELVLNGRLYYPDFIIKHPKTGKLYIWEHLGMIEKSTYQKNNLEKLSVYLSNGYYPNINLITTSETPENPLDPQFVEKLIEYFFL